MKYLKNVGFVVAVMSLMFCAACGAGFWSKNNNEKGNNEKPAPGTYSVSFNSNGGSSVTTMRVNHGDTISAPNPPPTRSGHTFDGWYSDSALTNRVTFPYTVTGNTMLYAKWTPTGGNDSGGIEKAVVRYLATGDLVDGEEATMVITFDHYGKRFRWDAFVENTFRQALVFNVLNNTYWGNFDNNEWIDIPNFMYDIYSFLYIGEAYNETELAPYRQLPDMLILNRPCKVYNLTDDGTEVTVGIWNGLILFYQEHGIEGGRYEAKAITFDVPDVAFTKTMNVTWMP